MVWFIVRKKLDVLLGNKRADALIKMNCLIYILIRLNYDNSECVYFGKYDPTILQSIDNLYSIYCFHYQQSKKCTIIFEYSV